MNSCVQTEPKGLSTKELRLLELLAEGKSVSAAALEMNVSRSAAYLWLKRPAVQAAHREALRQECAASYQRLAQLLPQATDVIAESIRDGRDPKTAFRLLEFMAKVNFRAVLDGIGPADAEVIRLEADRDAQFQEVLRRQLEPPQAEVRFLDELPDGTN